MLKIALTGNIASGKSAVQKLLQDKGLSSLCLDEVVDSIYKNCYEFKSKLKVKFKTSDKKEISAIVFKDKTLLKFLENLIYPYVLDEMNNFFDKNSKEKVVIVAAPMLFESNFDKFFDKIIFVSSNQSLRLKRLILRNNLSESDAMIRINSQGLEDAKIAKSDYVIYNNDDLKSLEIETNKLTEWINTLL